MSQIILHEIKKIIKQQKMIILILFKTRTFFLISVEIAKLIINLGAGTG